MTYTYWIDKQGGSHYHKEDCNMIQDPKFHYEPITRTKPRRKNRYWGLTPIKEDGKLYFPCGCMLPKRVVEPKVIIVEGHMGQGMCISGIDSKGKLPYQDEEIDEQARPDNQG